MSFSSDSSVFLNEAKAVFIQGHEQEADTLNDKKPETGYYQNLSKKQLRKELRRVLKQNGKRKETVGHFLLALFYGLVISTAILLIMGLSCYVLCGGGGLGLFLLTFLGGFGIIFLLILLINKLERDRAHRLLKRREAANDNRQ